MLRYAGILLVGGAALAHVGCAETGAPRRPSATPTLSFIGASGIDADVRRTVTEVWAGRETVLSTVDTAVWAPFGEDGAALASSEGAGIPGPVGWLWRRGFEDDLNRVSRFVDDAGVVHELVLLAGESGPWSRVEYRRNGGLVLDHATSWVPVTGGWAVTSETVTYHLTDGPDIRIGVRTRSLDVARAGSRDGMRQMGGMLAALLLPTPLAAQFYFRECNTDWLKWAGTVLLAELAWGKFAKSRSPSDFKKAAAATAAAGVALASLVDCMTDQPVQPSPA